MEIIITFIFLFSLMVFYLVEFSYRHVEIAIVDIRDYQVSCGEPINGAVHIPLPYLKRHAGEIPDKPVLVIASDHVEKNFRIRALLNKKVQIKGRYIAHEQKKEC